MTQRAWKAGYEAWPCSVTFLTSQGPKASKVSMTCWVVLAAVELERDMSGGQAQWLGAGKQAKTTVLQSRQLETGNAGVQQAEPGLLGLCVLTVLAGLGQNCPFCILDCHGVAAQHWLSTAADLDMAWGCFGLAWFRGAQSLELLAILRAQDSPLPNRDPSRVSSVKRKEVLPRLQRGGLLSS